MTALARFGHHPDHIIDYSVEVESLQSMATDFTTSGRAFNDDDSPATLDGLMKRLWRANGFRVGVVPEALAARRILVDTIGMMEPISAQGDL